MDYSNTIIMYNIYSYKSLNFNFGFYSLFYFFTKDLKCILRVKKKSGVLRHGFMIG